MQQFQYDQSYATGVGRHFGTYHRTFISDNGQIIAHLFEEGGSLVAYVSFMSGLNFETASDSYLEPLNKYAADHGFAGKLLLRYT